MDALDRQFFNCLSIFLVIGNETTATLESLTFCADGNKVGYFRFPAHPKWKVVCPQGYCHLCSPNAVLEYNKQCDRCVGETDVNNAGMY